MNLNTDVLVAGNYCHDTLLNARGSFEVLGGSASYISAVLASLGARFETVAKVGQDFLYLDKVKRPPLVAPGARTTHFVDDFRQGARRSLLMVECVAIEPADLGPGRARVGLACGVARELRRPALRRMRELCDVVVADIQGLIRAPGPGDRLVNLDFARTEFADAVHLIDYLKIGEEELGFVDVAALSQRTALLITRGRGGSSLVRAGRETRVPAFPAEEIDCSGAGDCFTAGFALGLLSGLEEARAMRVGNRLGALAVSQIGVPELRPAHADSLLGV
jgi:1D-myo-inositol 3-kinase